MARREDMRTPNIVAGIVIVLGSASLIWCYWMYIAVLTRGMPGRDRPRPTRQARARIVEQRVEKSVEKVVKVEVTRVVIATSTRIIATDDGDAVVKVQREEIKREKVSRLPGMGAKIRAWWRDPDNSTKVLIVCVCVVSVILFSVWGIFGHGFEKMDRWTKTRETRAELTQARLSLELAQARLDMDKTVRELFDQRTGLEDIDTPTRKLPARPTASEIRAAAARSKAKGT